MTSKRYKMVVDNVSGDIIIDLGSNEGNLHKLLLKKFEKSKIIGVDIEGKPDINHDLNRFPYPLKGNFADTVVAGEIIEHMNEPSKFLQECRRILKKSGKLLLTTPNAMGLHNIFAGWVYQKDFECSYKGHLYAWTVPEIQLLLEKNGFVIKKTELMSWWNRNLVFRLISHLAPRFGTTIFIVAEKVR